MFLDSLMVQCNTRETPLKIKTITAMDESYGMAESQNAEILSRFCQLSIEAGDTSIFPATIRFITTQGRMKFVRPLYKALSKSDEGKELAQNTFLEYYNFYHPIAAKMIATDLDVSPPVEDDVKNEESDEQKKTGDIDGQMKQDYSQADIQSDGETDNLAGSQTNNQINIQTDHRSDNEEQQINDDNHYHGQKKEADVDRRMKEYKVAAKRIWKDVFKFIVGASVIASFGLLLFRPNYSL